MVMVQIAVVHIGRYCMEKRMVCQVIYDISYPLGVRKRLGQFFARHGGEDTGKEQSSYRNDDNTKCGPSFVFY